MRSEAIKFSIVVPIYNVEQYLEECIKSIVQQSYTNFELILVDDGSPDNCLEICNKYQKSDNRIRVIHKDNGGLVSARKAGIKVATGDYAVCVDSDDWIDKDYLLSIHKVIKEYDPEIVCFNHTEVTSNGNIEWRSPYREGYYTKQQIIDEIYPNLIYSENGKTFPAAIWSKVYKIGLYRDEQLAVDNQIKIGEDVACTVPCVAKANSIYILDHSLYHYRRNNISMTKNRKPFPWYGPSLIYEHHKNRLVNMEEQFREQIDRRTVHALLNVVKSQFYRKESYFALRREIVQKLNDKIYKSVLQKCHYRKRSAMAFFHFCLKHKMLFPVYLLSKVR